MAANVTAHRNESDSENDAEYVPLPADEGSSSSDDEPEAKRSRADSPKLSAEEEEARKAALWASFQASVNETTSASTSTEPQKMVKVQKRYRFAGEDVTEVVEVPEDSPDAKKWPIWRAQDESASTSGAAEEPAATSASVVVESTVAVTPAAARPTPPAGKRPGPRKPKAQLAELPGRGVTKAKKLTTLEKSAMDWKAHVQSSETAGLQDELEANRRGGGYLEKVDFLQRVEERKDAVFEAAKAGKRRRA